MNGQIPRMNGGEFPTAAILAFMGMTGGAYYLYKQKNAENPSRVPDSNPDSIAKKELPGPNYLDPLVPGGFRVAEDTKDLIKPPDAKDLTKPAASKESSEN
jgi:hypothetical protein